MTNERTDPRRLVPELAGAVRDAGTRARNALASVLPGERPAWLVLELRGSYPARRRKRKLLSLENALGAERETSQEELARQVTALLGAPWLEGVVVRMGDLRVGLAAVHALRAQLLRLREGGKRVVVLANDLQHPGYLLATAADEIVAPESASLQVHGVALTVTFMAEALARVGVRFEKLAIEEYKNAGDAFALPAMSEAQREQYDALLDSLERHWLETVAAARGTTPEIVRGWIDRPVSSAVEAREAGMIDRVAYEDEVLGSRHRPLAQAARYLPAPVPRTASKRVAVVSLEGAIVPGASRKPPVPLPLLGDALAGSETLVRALRSADADPRTAAIVFHVESGGGSALASDLIWREVARIAARKPVVAVMGGVAASGGYYVLTHATRVLAAPATLTGSIGVLMGKFVLEGFNARYGFNPETLKRGRFATLSASSHGWDEEERGLLARYNREIYDRFVARVAEGRGLSRERVNEIGRGRIWSGRDALALGLVDELGDVERALALARELAGLPSEAPARNVEAPKRLVVPKEAGAEALLEAWAPLLRERALLMHPSALSVR